MPKAKPATKASGADQVDDFLAQSEHPHKAEIQAIREIILDADLRINEGIKWNAPSFFVEDHFATFRLQPRNVVQLVFHTGAKAKTAPTAITISAPAGVLEWAAANRCVMSFADASDVEAKRGVIESVVKQWIEQL